MPTTLLLLAACSRFEAGEGTVGGDDSAGTAGPADDTGPSARGPAVVLFIGDGMGFQHVTGGSEYATGADGGLAMQGAPLQGRVKTASSSGLTDSAAAGTALAAGEKTWNAVVGMDAGGEALENLVERARARGFATGVVTTDTLTGATPASFLVHVPTRYDAAAIASATVAALPDVLFGGGAADLAPLVPEGVTVVTTADELAAATRAGPIVGLFADGVFPYVADGYGTAPSLADMVDAALDRLEDDPDGFFLMVEGARIDHASHSNLTEVHAETVGLDEAVARALARAEAWGERDVTVLVTADHECGGLQLGAAGAAGEYPETSWRSRDHTNADVPAYAWGERAAVLDGERRDNLWVHAVLAAAVDETDVVAPDVPRLADGDLADLGEPLVTQTHATDFVPGMQQLDGLRLAADADGLWIGVDGAFDDASAATIVWLDLDYGAGTGVRVTDEIGTSDALLAAVVPDVELEGLGFDAALVDVAATYVRAFELYEEGGVRLFRAPDDVWWMDAVINFDDGNVALGAPAVDAGATGETVGGLEARIPWTSLAPDGLPAEGATIAAFAVLVDATGAVASNQALPPYADAEAPAVDALPVGSVAVLAVDGEGVAVGVGGVVP